jgi:hydrogenase expression/formation protein HypE
MSNNKNIEITDGLVCPIPMSQYSRILLAHGGGGTLSHQLIQKMFFSHFDNKILQVEHDGAVFEENGIRFAFSTDSYVVQPIFFPGGDIGELAVYGTVNDLAVCGAKPLFLSVGFIIEEGLEMETLWKIVQSIKKAADMADVKIVTGDTKVVDRGKGDKIFINTSGIGILGAGIDIAPNRVQVGDKIIINGKIAEHGVAILSAREEFDFNTTIKSDTAPLHDLILSILDRFPNVHMMRDPTRGGISSALNEIAAKTKLGIYLEESKIPIREDIKGICEMLGLDPLYIANEGKVLLFVPPNDADDVLETILRHQLGKHAAIIGEVVSKNPGKVVMKTTIGSHRIVDMLSGEQLPRIC